MEWDLPRESEEVKLKLNSIALIRINKIDNEKTDNRGMMCLAAMMAVAIYKAYCPETIDALGASM